MLIGAVHLVSESFESRLGMSFPLLVMLQSSKILIHPIVSIIDIFKKSQVCFWSDLITVKNLKSLVWITFRVAIFVRTQIVNFVKPTKFLLSGIQQKILYDFQFILRLNKRD